VDLPAPTRRPPWREFEAFYRTHFRAAWRSLARLGVPARDCEDAAQEVFVTAHRRWSTVREPQRRRAWLLGIVRKIAWRHRRADDRRARRLDVLAERATTELSLEHELQRRDAWRALLAFLDGLDEDKREAFVLGELEELPRPELAAALGVQPSTAYSRLQAARRRFVEHFAALDDEGCARVLVEGVPNEPDERAMARGWAALAPLFASAAPVGVAVPLLAKLAIATAVVGGTIAVAATHDDREPFKPVTSDVASRPDPSPPSAAIAAPATPPIMQRASTPSPSAAIAAPVPVRAARVVAIPEPPVPPPHDPRAEEVGLLSRAREAALAGDAAGARDLLDEHRRRFGESTTLAPLRRDIARSVDALGSTPSSGDEKQQEHRR
jgi:RNA polymerase sigma-70 factor (ECF subfamily)